VDPRGPDGAVVINGVAGFLAARHGQPFSAGAFTVSGGKIVAIDILADPGRLARLTLTARPRPDRWD
jgi:hypothetical protein